ncbi:MAG: hypothetical protein OYG31_00900 [Candidatus Kaiserbacteria bacterium]|nr:hypothetical protein [Candidatus Kaiserbacteria bacterium]
MESKNNHDRIKIFFTKIFSDEESHERISGISDDEKMILRDFIDREIENMKMFGPAENSYQKNIESLKGKLS